MITPAEENARMLASLLGIDEAAAAERLECRALVTAPASGPARALADEVIALLERTVDATEDEIEGAGIELVVGDAEPQTSLPRLWARIGADALVADIEPVDPAEGDPHPLYVAIAACPLAAAVLAQLIDSPALPKTRLPLCFEFAELGIAAEGLAMPVHIQAVMAGAGAVAHGFLRALRHIDVQGEITIVDPKNVGTGNANRCLYLTADDTGPKAEALALRAAADFGGLRLTSFVGTFAEHIAAAGGPPATAIVTVDSRRVRRSIQKELPGRILDASTTDVRGVVVHSNHQPAKAACLACIYRHVIDEQARERSIADGLGITLAEVQQGLVSAEAAERICLAHPSFAPADVVGKAYDSLFKQLCAEQALLTPEGRQVLAPFAFVSMLAGALLVIELLRSETGTATTNFWTVDPWIVPIGALRRLRSKLPDCEFCALPGVDEAAERLWGRNKSRWR